MMNGRPRQRGLVGYNEKEIEVDNGIRKRVRTIN